MVKADAMGEPSQTARTERAEARKPYASPRLVEYGRVADLVAGGMGSMVETMPNQMNKRTG